MQREGSCVGSIVQQPLDALLILVFFTVRNSGKEVIYLHGEEKKPILRLQGSLYVMVKLIIYIYIKFAISND